ncbi:choice-of-anchor tandem repeat GloVer-containing protein [Solimonas marina]|uniref:Beta-propeller repeat-containing protein n=1 Tax=Solimonas marina TaxID=2714601 RepID=A0A969WCS9_9GAMM|nr:choice-of-anchor tandem repeat GloVer-containing protein [Solimonas marina]NKF23725.1 hypothetical protein [Solimonas marina]
MADVYGVGGTITGLLAGQSIILRDNGGDDLSLAGTGADQHFVFSSRLASGSDFDVTVEQQAEDQVCTVINGSGTVPDGDIDEVAVRCYRYRQLYSFKGQPDGDTPSGRLALDSHGNLLGTTAYGGAASGGTIFKIAPQGAESIAYSFGADAAGGLYPKGLVTGRDGVLYGTTQQDEDPNTNGTVFSFDPDAQMLRDLWEFSSSDNDGAFPSPDLTEDAEGVLYGTTYAGGSSGKGVVYRLVPQGGQRVEQVLHSFSGADGDGQNPVGGLVLDLAGNLYGVTQNGGAGQQGMIFKIEADGTLIDVHDFGADGDGGQPLAGLVAGADGKLYGTTLRGGQFDDGTVYRFDPQRNTEDVVLSFDPATVGSAPYGGLLVDEAGNLFGTASNDSGANQRGAVFMIEATTNNVYVLYRFDDELPAAHNPRATLIMDADGNIYGTTQSGGTNNVGTVFTLSAHG